MTVYVPEEFTPAEADTLRRYFTNLDGPVFALVNLPEVVKGALFARYSRSSKSLRRLFLDEFVGDLDISGDHSVDATVGLRTRRGAVREGVLRVRRRLRRPARRRPPGLRAGLQHAHQDPRVGPADELPRAEHPVHRLRRARSAGATASTAIRRCSSSRFGTRYVGDMDRLFDTYALLLDKVTDHVRATVERDPDDSDFVFRQATRAKALDAVRGVLPAASLSNVGIYGSGQAFEALLLRMRAHPLPEARQYADLMLHELRKVIPSFLRRVDIADRGGRWTNYLATTRERTAELVDSLFGGTPVEHAPSVQLVDWDPRCRRQAARGDLLLAHEPARVAARCNVSARSGRPSGSR